MIEAISTFNLILKIIFNSKIEMKLMLKNNHLLHNTTIKT